MQARLEAMEMGRDADVGDVSEPGAEASKEEPANVTLEMRFFKSVLRSTSKPRLEVSNIYLYRRLQLFLLLSQYLGLQ